MSGTVLPFSSAQRRIGCLSDMAETISIGNSAGQVEKFLPEITNGFSELLVCRMGKKAKPQNFELHLGPWLKLFEVSETEAAKAGGCGQSYISNLIAGRKENPSALILLRISEYLGITVNDLYRMPPNRADVEPVINLSQRARETILARHRRCA
jgi:hypothetical protein